MSDSIKIAYNPIYDDPTLTMSTRNVSESDQHSDADTAPIIYSKSGQLAGKSSNPRLRIVRCAITTLTILVLLMLVCILAVFMFIFHHRLTEMEMRSKLPVTGNVSHTWSTTTPFPGRITDANTGSPVSNVTITTTLLHTLSGTFTTHSNIDGEFELPITPNLKYTISFQHPAYRPLEIPHFHLKPMDSDNAPRELTVCLISIQLNTSELGVVAGKVVDGNTTEGIGNVSVMLRNGLRNQNGGLVGETVTGANGTWQVSLAAGHYTACFEKAGYMEECVGIVALGGHRKNYTHKLRYVFKASSVRFVLEWEHAGVELEGRLTTPTGNMAKTGAKRCTQQRCRKTVVITKQLPGKYTYSVGIVTPQQPDPWLLAAVETKVTVFISDQVEGYYHVPHRNGTIWNAVELVGDKLTFTNTLL